MNGKNFAVMMHQHGDIKAEEKEIDHMKQYIIAFQMNAIKQMDMICVITVIGGANPVSVVIIDFTAF